MSRNDLRDRCGLSYPYIAELEKGRKTPSGKALDAIATALQMRPHELLARAEALAGSGETPLLEQSPSVPGRWFAAAPTLRAARFPRPRRGLRPSPRNECGRSCGRSYGDCSSRLRAAWRR